MKNVLFIFLISCFSLTVISCGDDKEEYTENSVSSTTTTDYTTTTGDTTPTAEQMGGSMQGVELSLSTVVTTLAGTGSSGSSNGTGTSASFNYPNGITTDGTNLYVGDNRNHLIRKIE